jgi:hypothetical protein
MARKTLSTAQWNALRSEMRQIMIDVARHQQTITYSELCAMLKTAYLHHRAPALTQLLIEIGAQEAKAGRPVLPAVVVAKASGMPGGGYFKSDTGKASPLTPRNADEGSNDPKAMWEADLQRVFEYWSNH